MATKPGRPHNFRALSKPKQVAKHDHRHYWPYIPVLLIIISTFLVSLIQPIQKRGVLAYATNLSSNTLLSATNQQRTSNGVGTLQTNSQLTAAAQAKANDMIARNYWSHNTPDGQEPWVFMKNAGYNYLRAGENLAYGFDDSGDTVTGWMNSPSHKANLLDTSFTEVGFGFANGENYNQNGKQTVVVAMYGKPQVLASTGNGQAAPVTKPAVPVSSTPATPIVNPPTPVITQAETKPAAAPVTTDTPITAEPVTKNISRLASLTDGRMPWATFAVGVITGIALMAILFRHAAGMRHMLRDGERFVMHHPLLDTVLVSLVLVGVYLTQTSGFIR